MDARGSRAIGCPVVAVVVALLVSGVAVNTTSGCAAGTGDVDTATMPVEAPDEEEPLDVTVDALDVVHGALRISATMVDGAADVSIRLAGDCEHREVGGGLSTLSTFVWSLGDSDVADAIACGLTVRARARDGSRHVSKVADLALAVDVSAQGDNAADAPQLRSTAPSEGGIDVVFASVARSARLTAGDSILEAASDDGGDTASNDASDTGRFTIPRIDFARAVLRQRALVLDGASFVPWLSVGGTTVQGPEAAEQATEEVSEGTDEQTEQAEQEDSQEEEAQQEEPEEEVEPSTNE